jgi:REP element-mobilizing transposase RayT
LEEIENLSQRFSTVDIEKYTVMPNHVHILLTLKRQGQSPCPTRSAHEKTLGGILGAYKSITTKKLNQMDRTPGRKIWQFRYYDHVIRDENDFLTKWNYIDTNPARWREDEEYCEG